MPPGNSGTIYCRIKCFTSYQSPCATINMYDLLQHHSFPTSIALLVLFYQTKKHDTPVPLYPVSVTPFLSFSSPMLASTVRLKFPHMSQLHKGIVIGYEMRIEEAFEHSSPCFISLLCEGRCTSSENTRIVLENDVETRHRF